jgi:hypothetical protein
MLLPNLGVPLRDDLEFPLIENACSNFRGSRIGF